MNVNILLDKCAKACAARNDAALCLALKVKKQTLSNWRNGHRFPDTVACDHIAQLSGVPLTQVLGIVGEARAISREEKQVWRKLAGIAASLFLAVAMSAFVPSTAQAASTHYAK